MTESPVYQRGVIKKDRNEKNNRFSRLGTRIVRRV